MLIARDSSGFPVEAARELLPGAFSCPACDGRVLLKRGRVKVAHFAHTPNAECWTDGESVAHLQGKRLLAEQFQLLGYDVQLEETYRAEGRRVDVAVTVPDGAGRYRVAVEVQDSPIAVDTMKARTRIDRALGFEGTTWIFTDKRAHALLAVGNADVEVKIPNEMLWVDNRYEQGIFVLDLNDPMVWNVELGSPAARYSEWYTEDGGAQSSSYLPRTLRCPIKHAAGFSLSRTPGKFEEWAVIFSRE